MYTIWQTRGKKILESQTNNLEKASNSLANLSEDLDNTFEATNSQQIGIETNFFNLRTALTNL